MEGDGGGRDAAGSDYRCYWYGPLPMGAIGELIRAAFGDDTSSDGVHLLPLLRWTGHASEDGDRLHEECSRPLRSTFKAHCALAAKLRGSLSFRS